MKKVLLIEPPGGFIRLDRCMQRINSWGGEYRFPLNLARIGAHLLSHGHRVHFVDLQADNNVNLGKVLNEFAPDICILSSGFPSMHIDSLTALNIKKNSPKTHVSTFGVVPTLLKESFFHYETWNFNIPFDSVVTGGDPAFGYENILDKNIEDVPKIVKSSMEKIKSIETYKARILFNHNLYKSPFTGEKATYIEGSFGCPHNCSFCVVPVLYNKQFSKRAPEDVVKEIQFVIEQNNVSQITLWDEGTTFQKSFIKEVCEGLIELRKSRNPALRNFIWTTRSTTALLNEEIIELMSLSGLTGLTIGIESFDKNILDNIPKNISLNSNNTAIRLLSKYKIISIGHIILGQLNDTKETIENTIQLTLDSDLTFAQFYCAVPYPGTLLNKEANEHDLIRVKDLTKYELSNPIMDTLGGIEHYQVGKYRQLATKKFWTEDRWSNLNRKIDRGSGVLRTKQDIFLDWN